MILNEYTIVVGRLAITLCLEHSLEIQRSQLAFLGLRSMTFSTPKQPQGEIVMLH
jgi:hypothetical protein